MTSSFSLARALAAVLLLLALAAPAMYDVALGIVAALYSIALTLAWTRVFTTKG